MKPRYGQKWKKYFSIFYPTYKERWLECFEDHEDEYEKIYNATWYCLEFPEGNHFEGVPEIVMREVFVLE